MNLPGKGRNFQRFPCELTPAQIDRLKQRAEQAGTTYAAFTRALIDHGLNCPRFLRETSSDESIQPK